LRLEKFFRELGRDAKRRTCEAIDVIENSTLHDAGLIAAANRIEHYEIAGYGSAKAFAQTVRARNRGIAAGADVTRGESGGSETHPPDGTVPLR
jgi:hypothetical protein